MVWTNGPFSVWHGTIGPWADQIVWNGIDLARCVHESDFGRGFYVTRIRDHAILHANERYADLKDQYDRAQMTFTSAFDPVCAALVEFTVDLGRLGALDTLAFVQGIPEWLEFVQHCRLPTLNHKPTANLYYDVVYGPMFADDAAIPGREQISFHSPAALRVLRNAGARSITLGRPRL